MRWADASTASAALLGYPARSALKLLSLSRSHPGLLPRGASVLDLGCSPGAFLQVAAEAVGERGVVFGIDLAEVDVGALERRRAPFLAAAAAGKHGLLPAPVFTRVGDVLELTPQTLSALFRQALERHERLGEGKAAAAAAGFFPRSAPAAVSSFGAVLSDLCHSTLGVRSADAARSLALARAAARLALGGGGEAEEGEVGPLPPSRCSFSSPPSSSPFGRGGVLARGGSFLVKILEGADTPAFAAALKPCFDSVKWARPPATRSGSTEVYLLGLGRR